MIPARLSALLVALAITLAGVGGFWLAGTDDPVPEDVSAKPQVRQPDASVIATRVPDAKPPKAPHVIPKGAREARRVRVEVQPTQPDCDPVRVNLSLIEQDGGQRVIASAENGLVLSALDTPIVPQRLLPPRRPWVTGMRFDPTSRRPVAAFVQRDMGRLVVGAEVGDDGQGALRPLVSVGWRW